MTTIAGIDPSLTRTGIALLAANHGHTTVETLTIPTTGHHTNTIPERYQRIHDIATAVTDHTAGADLAVIEGPAFGQHLPGTWDRAGLWWHIVAAYARRATPVAVVSPATRAKWATDNGHAKKKAVYNAAAEMWAPFWTPTKNGDDNESDALILASMGAQWLHLLPFTATAEQHAAITHATWPQNETKGLAS